MSRCRKPSSSLSLRRVVACLLACLLPLQGIAASVIAVVGPSHVHKIATPSRPTDTVLVLDDFRRPPQQAAPRPIHVATAFGHFHRAEAPLRHHHSLGDTSVVYTGFDAPGGATDGDEGGLGLSLAAFVALIPSAAAWAPTPRERAFGAHSPWAASSQDPERLERPPRPT